MPNYYKGLGGYQIIVLPEGTRHSMTVPGLFEQLSAVYDWQQNHQRYPIMIRNFDFSAGGTQTTAGWAYFSSRSDTNISLMCLGGMTITVSSADMINYYNNYVRVTEKSPFKPTSTSKIKEKQVATYTRTNQTYAPEDVTATLLVADPQTAMEAVNKRTLEALLPPHTAADSGKILSVNAQGQLTWITPP